MATSPNLVNLSKASVEGLVEYCKATSEYSFNTWPMREHLAYLDREYFRENIYTKDQKISEADIRNGNKRRIADLCVPIVEPQIETSLSFLASIFLTGTPLFGVVAPPDQMDQAKAMESIIDENSKHGGWVRELLMFMRSGLKYNFHAIEVDWKTEKTYNPFTAPGPQGNESAQRQVIWRGNCIRNIDMYNVLFDPRVKPAEQHKKAEYCGYVELMSRIKLKEFIQTLSSTMNVKDAYEAGTGTINRYYIPQFDWDSIVRQNIMRGFDWTQWAMLDRVGGAPTNYRNVYEVATRYCRIVPSDFGIQVPARNTPQIWKFITVNEQVLIHAEKVSNAHNLLPILFGQPIEDGLGYQTKSLEERLIPVQDSASAFWNARLAARRRAISDRGLYNPLLVREADINSDNPSAKIPVRPSAYGKTLSDAYYPIPFEDRDSGSFVQDASQMMAFANFITGQNQVQQGMFVKGNKTDQQFQDTQNASSGRQNMMALFMEDQVFTPLKEILKLNILQYQSAGSVYSYIDEQMYEVDPVKLREASLNFKIADGLNPKSKIVSSDVLIASFQAITAMPVLQQKYDVPKLFTYLMETQGADLKPFELKVAPNALPAPTTPVEGTEGARGAAPPPIPAQ